MRRRQPLPDAIANAPELFSGLEVYYEAFLELTTCRQVGFGEGPIPWDAIDRYAERHGIADEEDYEDFVDMVRALDDAYLKHRRDKAEREAGRV